MSAFEIYKLHQPPLTFLVKVVVIGSIIISALAFTGYYFFTDTNYIDSEDIIISGNTDLKAKANRNNWPGDGTKDNPIIISNLRVGKFEILSTTFYLKIANNYIFGSISKSTTSVVGIYLSNAANVIIQDNEISLDFENYGESIPPASFGVKLKQSSGNVINDNKIRKFDYGVSLASSKENIVENNKISNNNMYGIDLFESNSNYLANNRINDNGRSENQVGVHFKNSKENEILNNELYYNHFKFEAETVEGYIQERVSNNRINGRDFLFYQNRFGLEIPLNAAQIVLIQCSSFDIRYQQISDMDTGIFAAFSYNLTFQDNSFSNNKVGIGLHRSTNSTISENNFSYNTIAVHFTEHSDSNVVSFNTFEKSRDIALYFETSSFNTIERNEISKSRKEGVILTGVSNYNNIQFNNFIENNGAKPQATDNGANNKFHSNYWSDWLTPDDNNDGWVDLPYLVGGSTY
ncbi:MAG: NosD domain-containing protein, partial [Candidatus Kariarchaeaceae archaeon]